MLGKTFLRENKKEEAKLWLEKVVNSSYPGKTVDDEQVRTLSSEWNENDKIVLDKGRSCCERVQLKLCLCWLCYWQQCSFILTEFSFHMHLTFEVILSSTVLKNLILILNVTESYLIT